MKSLSLLAAVASTASICTWLIVTAVEDRRADIPPISSFYSAATHYGVFSGQVPSVNFPTKVEKDARNLSAGEERLPLRAQLGPRVSGSERLLLDIGGKPGPKVYGFTTAFGRACIVIPDVMAGCDGGVGQDQPIAWMGGNVGDTGIIIGLARDNVETIETIIGNRTRAIKFSNNTFYVVISQDRLEKLSALRVVTKNGNVVKIKVDLALGDG